MFKQLLFISIIVLSALSALAQQPDTTSKAAKKASSKDTLVSTKNDSLNARKFKPKPKPEKVYHPDSTHDPHKAIMRSLMVPGWGQIYNHSWWKVPVIYAGLGLLADAIIFNGTYYNEFLQLSKYREYGIIPVPGNAYYAQAIAYQDQPDQAIYDAEEAYRRNRDLCILGFVGAWGINVLDAYIDAKFIRSYSVDTNFTMKISPGLLNQPSFALNTAPTYIPGIKITFAF